MDALNGLLYINNQDAYAVYGAYLAEEKEGSHKNYDSLMKPSKAKAHVAVNFREDDGEKYPDTLLVASEARDIDLRFAIIATDKTVFLQQYKAFLGLLKTGANGWLDLRFPELGMTFRVFYKESSGYEQLTYFDDGEVGAILTVKFHEPIPSL